MLDRFIRSRGYIKPNDVLIAIYLQVEEHVSRKSVLRMTVARILAVQQLQGNIELHNNAEIEVTML